MDGQVLSFFKEVSVNQFQFITGNQERELSARIEVRIDGTALQNYLKNDIIALLKEVRVDQIHFSTRDEARELSTKIELKLDCSVIMKLLKEEIASLLREVTVEEAALASSEQDKQFSAKIGLKLSEDRLKQMIKSELMTMFSDFSASQVQLSLHNGGDNSLESIELKIHTFSMKNQRQRGITLEELSLRVFGYRPDDEPAAVLKKIKIIVDRLLVKISQKWFNDELKSFRSVYEEKGISDVEVVFLDRLMMIRGSYKKGVSFPFSVEIKTRIDRNRMVIELSQFNLMEVLPLPNWIQNILIDFVKDKLKNECLEIEKSTFYYDILKAIPLNVELTFKDLRVEKEFLILEI